MKKKFSKTLSVLAIGVTLGMSHSILSNCCYARQEKLSGSMPIEVVIDWENKLPNPEKYTLYIDAIESSEKHCKNSEDEDWPEVSVKKEAKGEKRTFLIREGVKSLSFYGKIGFGTGGLSCRGFFKKHGTKDSFTCRSIRSLVGKTIHFKVRSSKDKSYECHFEISVK